MFQIGSEQEGAFTFDKTKYDQYRAGDGLTQLANIKSACPEDTICDCVVSDVPVSLEQVRDDQLLWLNYNP